MRRYLLPIVTAVGLALSLAAYAQVPCRDGDLQRWLALLGRHAIRCLPRPWRRQDMEYGSAVRDGSGDRWRQLHRKQPLQSRSPRRRRLAGCQALAKCG